MVSRKTALESCIAFVVLVSLATAFVFLAHHLNLPHDQNLDKFQELFYTQKLDHFNLTHKTTFQQRFFLDSTHWGGANASSPIFVFLGGHESIKDSVGQIGILNECVPKLGGLVIYIEHRFYGDSVPYAPIENAIATPEVRIYLTSAQTIADHVEIIAKVKADFSAMHSPVILMGGFYGGVLATWIMIKYPEVAIGAVASSTPIYYFYNNAHNVTDDFCGIISHDFKDTNLQCHDLIRDSWCAIDDLAAQADGLNGLSSTFFTCSPLRSADELKSYLAHFYAFAAQYSGPVSYWINKICDAITTSANGDIVSRIADATLFMGNRIHCQNITYEGPLVPFFGEERTMIAWDWQQCYELAMPIGCSNSSMLPVGIIDSSQRAIDCQQKYGKFIPLHQTESQYGGKDLEAALSKISGKMIFSNGRKDPYSSKGVMHNISGTTTAITTEEGTQCVDLQPEEPDDPEWLKSERQQEITLLSTWIEQYKNRT